MNNRDQALPKGTILHGKVYTYRIEKVLGQGTFGITYLASTSMQGPLGEVTVQVAVKEFFAKELDSRMADGTVTARTEKGVAHKYARAFLRESENLSKMKHPGIVNVLESFEDKGTCYYSMEYLSGGCLDDKVKGQGIPEEEALKITTKIGEALAYMHEQKVMHLDLKPKNVMLKADGSPVIIDFGLSKQYDEKGEPESSTTIGLGTPGYAPIEQANQTSGRKFQPTIDIYALGATLYKMLTGETPPNASDIFNEGFPEDSLIEKGVTPVTVNVIRKAMSAAKKNRPQSVSEFLTLLAGEEGTTFDEPPTMPDPRPTSQPEPKPIQPKTPPENKSSKVWLWALIGGIAILMVLGLVFFLSRKNKPISDSLLINGNSVCRIELESSASECEFTIEKNFEERWVYFGVPNWCTPKAEVGKLTLSVSENKTKEERSATIIFQKKNGDAVLGNLILNQKAKSVSKKNTEQGANETKVGSIRFESTPSGAAIWIDGKNTKKTTPDIIEGITVGKHNVKLILDGYEDYSGTVTVSSKKRMVLDRTLTVTNDNWYIVDNDDPYREKYRVEVDDEEVEEEALPFALVEEKPKFQGGDANTFSAWVNKNLNYPEIAHENGVQGRVTLQFTVNTDGSVSNVKVLRGVDESLDKEAVRVVSMSPKWTPGKQRERPVKVTYVFPVIFQLR